MLRELVTRATHLPLSRVQATSEVSLQRLETGTDVTGREAALVHNVLRSSGTPLEANVRADAEARLGHDFSQVRVHADETAAKSADAVNARAYTVGPDVVFAAGQYSPKVSAGRALLFHELTHVIQQGSRREDVDALVALPQSHPLEAQAREAATDPDRVANRDETKSVSTRQAVGMLARDAVEPSSTLGGHEQLSIEFNAFIPGYLGRRFSSFPHARNLSNQGEFDAQVGAVTSPDSWKPEPPTTEEDVKEPGSARNTWFCSTDQRDFGGGSHRVGFKGSVYSADIGMLRRRSSVFLHDCNASHRVRTTDTGWIRSEGEKGRVDGPHAITPRVKDVEETVTDAGPTSSSVQTEGSAAYAFMPTLSPDIDYNVKFQFDRKPQGMVEVSGWIEHNLFPFYEVLINGTTFWKFNSTDTDPSLRNLNTSRQTFFDPLTF